MKRSSSLAALLVVLVACGDRRPELVPVPWPDLGAMEPAVRRQLEDEIAALRELEEDAGAAGLATELGELGRRFHVYELLEAAEACYENARRLAPGEFRWTYYHAVALQAAGRFEEAAAAFRRALELRPADLPARVRLGEVLRQSGEEEKAREELEEALRIDPECALAHYFLGQIESAAGAHEAAARRLEKALELQPGASEVRYPLAQVYRALGEDEKASRLLAGLGSEPVRLEDPLMHALDDLRTGAAAHLRRAARAQVDGAYEAALAEYRLAVEADPTNPEARQGLALMLLEQDDAEGAVAELRRALRLAPDDARLATNLAALLARRGALDEALELYAGVLERDPAFVHALRGMADAQIRAGRPRQALATLDRLVALGTSSAVTVEAHLVAAELLVRQGDLDQAIRRYERAVALDPGRTEAHFGLANLLGRRGRYREAAASYRAVLELEGERTPARLGEATALSLAGDHAAARRTLEEGLRARPESSDLAHALARLLATCPDEAVRDGARALELARAVHRAEPALESGETVAMALAELGRLGEAADWQRRLLAQVAGSAPPEIVARLRANLERYEKQRTARP